MGVKYNPFAGNLDIVDSPSGDFSDIDISGDLSLGTGTPTTTLQAVTPTANRTISFPDATGTVALVSGADGTVQYNEAGVLKGNSDFTVDPDWNNASTVFTGLKLNVTDTASAADSNLVDIQSNGTSRMVVHKDGYVGINASTPVNLGSGITVVEAKGGTTARGGIFRSSNSDATIRSRYGIVDSEVYVGVDSAHPLVFTTTQTERARITSDGYLRLAAGTGGIQFGGDTAAANALDDYEEGSSTVTYTTTGGVFSHGGDRLIYTKIGNTVYCRMAIAAATTGGSLTPGTGEIIITGLPFVVQASGGANSSFVASAALGVVHQGISNSFNTQPFCVVPISGTSTLKLKASGSTSAYMDATAFASTTNTQYNWISTEFWYNV